MKKKLLKLLVLTIIVSILVFTIYKVTKQDKINLVVLGDQISEGYSKYLLKELKVNNYTSYIKEKETIDNLTYRIEITSSIKRDLRDSELTIISIGLNDFYNNVKPIGTNNILDLKDEISLLLPKLDDLLKEIRKYDKYQIILIGYYNPVPFLFNTSSNELDILFMYIDSMVKDIVKKYDVAYISLYDMFKANDYVDNIYPNGKGYKAISKEIINYVKQN